MTASRDVAQAREEQVRRTQAARRDATIALEAVRMEPGRAAMPALRAAALDAGGPEVASALRAVLAGARARWVATDESPVTGVAFSPDAPASSAAASTAPGSCATSKGDRSARACPRTTAS